MAKRKTDQPKYFIREEIDRPVSKREFLKISAKEATRDLILQADLVKSKTFTKAQINGLVRDKVLFPTIYRSRVYFKKDSVLQGIKYLSESPKLFAA